MLVPSGSTHAVDDVWRAVTKPGIRGACSACGTKPPPAVARVATADDADAARTSNANAPIETNLMRISPPSNRTSAAEPLAPPPPGATRILSARGHHRKREVQ